MEKEDIRINRAIIHILDSTMGMPVLSDILLEPGSDFYEFLKTHIYRLLAGDELKTCSFEKEVSEVYLALQDYSEENFIPISKMLAGMLFEIMNSNIQIPQGDLLIVEYRLENRLFLALLKMNYRTSYTHRAEAEGSGNKNEVMLQRAILPSEGQRLSEAAFIDLNQFEIRLIEKKFEVNGEKTYYFSKLFLKCSGTISQKAKLDIVTKAVETVQKKYLDEKEQFEAQMKAKSIIHEELEEDGMLDIPKVIDKIFMEKEEYKQEVREKLDKYHVAEAQVIPQSENTTRRFQKQYLATDTGIELKIPMEQYNNPENVQFITNEDGMISVLLKNIGHIVSK